jgi:hypothetical protein
MRSANSVLGLLITDSMIAVAEIECTNGTYHLMRFADYFSPAGNGLESFAPCVADFKIFLKTNGFKSKRAVVGIQARYLLTAIVDLPAVKNESMINDMVKIGLEKKLKIDLSEIAFDYYLSNNDNAVVLATLHKHIDSIKTFLDSLAIEPLYITGMAPCLALSNGRDNTHYIMVFPDHVEIVIIDKNIIKAIKQIPSVENTDKIISVIKRDILLTSDTSQRPELCIFDCSHHKNNIADLLQAELTDKAGIAVAKYAHQDALPELAGSIAQKAVCDRNFRLNLLRNCMSENSHRPLYRKAASKIAIGLAVLLIAAGIFAITWHLDRAETAKLRQQLTSISGEAAQARSIIDKINYTKQWFDTTPRYLEILRQLTTSFPQSDHVWLSTMAVDESFNQVITGKATEEKAILDLLDNLKKNTAFDAVKILYMRKAGKNTEMITFAMSFKIKKD